MGEINNLTEFIQADHVNFIVSRNWLKRWINLIWARWPTLPVGFSRPIHLAHEVYIFGYKLNVGIFTSPFFSMVGRKGDTFGCADS